MTTTTLLPATNGVGLPPAPRPPARATRASSTAPRPPKLPPKKVNGSNGHSNDNGHAELIVYRRLDQLAIHPLAKDMPMLPADAPEMISLVASIELNGMERQPIVIDARDRIMDGRHRGAAAKRAGLLDVPCIIRPEEEAGSIIIDSLAGRRHLTKGALAYVSWPLLDEAAKSGTAARLARLNAHKPTQSAYGKSREELCTQIGFSTDLADQAAKVHALFASGERHTFPGKLTLSGKPEELTLRQYFEPCLLVGHPVTGKLYGLGAVIEAIAGLKSSGKANLSGRDDHAGFVCRATATLGFHFAKIAEDDDAAWRAIEERWTQSARQFPERAREALARALRKASKGEHI